jgi:hypothetical protein
LLKKEEYFKRIKNYGKKEKDNETEINVIYEKIDNFESKLSSLEPKNGND